MKAFSTSDIFRFTTMNYESILICSCNGRNCADKNLKPEPENPRMQGPTFIWTWPVRTNFQNLFQIYFLHASSNLEKIGRTY
jgi:hypothetical protein